jgi:hypothetical protein
MAGCGRVTGDGSSGDMKFPRPWTPTLPIEICVGRKR